MFGPIIAIAEGAIMGAMSAWPTAHTAKTAKHRLRWVVKADREAVPAWRWVQRVAGFIPGLTGKVFIWDKVAGKEKRVWRLKARFRWERRA